MTEIRNKKKFLVELMKVKVDHIYLFKIVREVDSLQSKMRDFESPAGRCLMSWKGGERYAPASIGPESW